MQRLLPPLCQITGIVADGIVGTYCKTHNTYKSNSVICLNEGQTYDIIRNMYKESVYILNNWFTYSTQIVYRLNSCLPK